MKKSRFSLLLGAALAVPAPSPAALVRRSAPAAAFSVAGWRAAMLEIAGALQARPGMAGASPLLGQASARLRLELALRPNSPGALSFLRRMPAEAASAHDFSKLLVSEQVRLLDAAVHAAAADLQPRAEALIAQASQGGLFADDQAALQEISRQWFFLAPDTARAVREIAAAQRAAKTLDLASRIARSLARMNPPSSPVTKDDKDEAAAAVNVAARLLDEAPRGSRVEAALAPHVARVLDDAEARARERGAPPGMVYRAVIDEHVKLFGKARDKALFKALRDSGEWTEFVAAVSLHAAERMGTLGEDARNCLAKMAETDELRLAIPPWHPLFGRYSSIAEWLAQVHGKPDDAKDLKGLPLFTAFGIPVQIRHSAWPIIALFAVQFALITFPVLSPGAGVPIHLAQGAAAAVLLDVSVLAHEFGHALAAKAFGIRTRQIFLNFLGGGADVVRGFRQARPEFVIALAGPIVSALCGVAAFLLAPLAAGTLLAPILAAVAQLNFFLAAFNLLPFFPMDGGRVLRAALTKRLGNYRATKVTAWLGITLSLLAAALGPFVLPGAARLPGILLLLSAEFFAAFFVYASWTMSAHPGTVTTDETSK